MSAFLETTFLIIETQSFPRMYYLYNTNCSWIVFACHSLNCPQCSKHSHSQFPLYSFLLCHCPWWAGLFSRLFFCIFHPPNSIILIELQFSWCFPLIPLIWYEEYVKKAQQFVQALCRNAFHIKFEWSKMDIMISLVEQ